MAIKVTQVDDPRRENRAVDVSLLVSRIPKARDNGKCRCSNHAASAVDAVLDSRLPFSNCAGVSFSKGSLEVSTT